MKKIIVAGIASAVLTSGALASEMYIGVEGGKLTPNVRSNVKQIVPLSLPVYSVFMGQSIGNNMSAELGFISIPETSRNFSGTYRGSADVTRKTTLSGSGYYVDLVATTDKSKGLYAIGAIGVGKSKIKDQWKGKVAGTPYSGSDTKSRGALRIGVGVGYHFGNGFRTRLMVRQANHKYANLRSFRTVTLGLSKSWGWDEKKAKQ